MNQLNKHRNDLKESLSLVFKCHPESRYVKYRYRTLLASIRTAYPNLTSSVDKEVMMKFIKDVVYLDRLLRLKTSGVDEEKKEELSQSFQLEELNLEMNLESNIKQLKQL